jgi:hypothetical protein
MDHNHINADEFEAGCPACELDEVSLQDTGRRWAARVIKEPPYAATRGYFVVNPMPRQQDRRWSA